MSVQQKFASKITTIENEMTKGRRDRESRR